MADKETSPMLWLGLALAGVGVWWYMKHKGTGTAAPGATLLPAAQPQGQAPNPTQLLPMTNVPITATPAPQPAMAPAAAAAPNGIDPTVYATVIEWAQSTGKPTVMAFANAAVPAEFTGMYNIITNYWDKGISGSAMPQALTDFWNNLRAEYDPNHVYW